MLWLKGCPRCAGDLMPALLEEEPAVSCLQCGYMGAAPGATKRTEAARMRSSALRHRTFAAQRATQRYAAGAAASGG